jgi:hypothetical protein
LEHKRAILGIQYFVIAIKRIGLAIEHPSQGTSTQKKAGSSTSTLRHQREDQSQVHNRVHNTTIECTRAQKDSVAADLVLERAIRLSLRFLGFLEASRVPLISINSLVYT